jgi:PAS domain-containing protein
MSGRQKDLVLILARELASNIATPMLVLDHNGTMVFFNEAAEVVMGASFSQTGEIIAQEWDKKWPTTDADGNPISLLDCEISRVIWERTPAHQHIRVRGLDGGERAIEATAYPLFASKERFVGAAAVFWCTDGGEAAGGES